MVVKNIVISGTIGFTIEIEEDSELTLHVALSNGAKDFGGQYSVELGIDGKRLSYMDRRTFPVVNNQHAVAVVFHKFMFQKGSIIAVTSDYPVNALYSLIYTKARATTSRKKKTETVDAQG